MNIFFAIRKWFQPYWNPKPNELKKPKKVNGNSKKEDLSENPPSTKKEVKKEIKKPVSNDKKSDKTKNVVNQPTNKNVEKPKNTVSGKIRNEDGSVDSTTVRMKMVQTKIPVTQILSKTKYRPNADEIFYYHDDKVHELVAHLLPNTRKRYQMCRNDEERLKLRPLFVIKNVGSKRPDIDRTHLIPIGYHGSENNNILVVPWLSTDNQGDIKRFEDDWSEYDEPIYWYVSIRRRDYGAVLNYMIISVKTGRPILKKEFMMGSVESPIVMDWSPNYEGLNMSTFNKKPRSRRESTTRSRRPTRERKRGGRE